MIATGFDQRLANQRRSERRRRRAAATGGAEPPASQETGRRTGHTGLPPAPVGPHRGVRRADTQDRTHGAPAAMHTAEGAPSTSHPTRRPKEPGSSSSPASAASPEPPYDSLNVSKKVGDDPEAVDENLSMIRRRDGSEAGGVGPPGRGGQGGSRLRGRASPVRPTRSSPPRRTSASLWPWPTAFPSRSSANERSGWSTPAGAAPSRASRGRRRSISEGAAVQRLYRAVHPALLLRGVRGSRRGVRRGVRGGGGLGPPPLVAGRHKGRPRKGRGRRFTTWDSAAGAGRTCSTPTASRGPSRAATSPRS